MKKEIIKEHLADYDLQKVNNYMSYLFSLENMKKADGSKVNWWISKVTDPEFVQAFKKVDDQGLSLDGESVSLSFRGKLMITYDYHAYKNKVLIRYPETTFDIQLVNEGDVFSFQKTSGKIEYQHNIKDPFATDKKIVGAYCIVKNKRGEFLTTINMDDINKIKAVAKTQTIWNKWFDRMVLKTVIKRACSTHFKDEVADIDQIDNLNYDLSMKTNELSEEIKKEVLAFKDEMDLLEYANSNEMKDYSKNDEFIKLVNQQRQLITE